MVVQPLSLQRTAATIAENITNPHNAETAEINEQNKHLKFIIAQRERAERAASEVDAPVR